MNPTEIVELYSRYGDELVRVATLIQKQYFRMQAKGYGTTFGDAEGEFLYLLIRHYKPSILFEISPNAGYSTNYILAAITANGHGKLHSFELQEHFNGIRTEEVIRGNLNPEWDGQRLHVHIGDAVKTVGTVEGHVDFCLLDSCHDQWFAEWYVNKLFPRVQGILFIQDIAFHDRLEPSSEASYVWKLLKDGRMDFMMSGWLERQPAIISSRSKLIERREYESNSVFLQWPPHHVTDEREWQNTTKSVESFLDHWRNAQREGDAIAAADYVRQAAALVIISPQRSNRGRLALRIADAYRVMSDYDEESRWRMRALSYALSSDRFARRKGLKEFAVNVRHKQNYGLYLCSKLLALLLAK
jgi:predicted O-methyltransferase YrrM